MQDASSQDRRLVRTSTPGIYKRGGSYVVVFRDPQGKQRKRAARTLSEARDLKATLTADVRRGEYRTLSRLTFADYAPDWIGSYQGRTSRGIRQETLADYRWELERNAVPFFGRMQLAAIEPRDIKRFAAELASRGLAPATVKQGLAPVRAMLATAFEDGLIRANPAAGVRIVQTADAERGVTKTKALSEPELVALLAEVPEEWRVFFTFLAHSGLRIGEAIALTWADVDFGQRRFKVRRRLYQGRFDAPKSKYGRRTIPLSTGLAQDLWQLRGSAPDDAPVFASATGGFLDQSNVMARILKPAARRAGVPWAGFHTFRHTAATILFRNGLNAKQVQLWLGHHSPSFTLDTYVHLLADDLPDADFLDALTGGDNGATRPAENGRDALAVEQPQNRIPPTEPIPSEVAAAGS